MGTLSGIEVTKSAADVSEVPLEFVSPT